MKKYVDIILILVSFLWGIKPIVMKWSMNSISAEQYNMLKFIFAVVGAWIFMLSTRQFKKIDKKDYKKISFISIFGFFIFQWLYAVGLKKTMASNASIIMGTLPILVLILNVILGIEKLTFKRVSSIVISFVGIIFVIISSDGFSFGGQNFIGNMIILVSAMGYTIYTVFSKDLVRKYPAIQITTIAITISTFLMMFVVKFNIDFSVIDFRLFISLVYTGIITTFIANYLWTWALKRSSSTRVALYNNLNPVFTVFFAYFILGESINVYTIVGILAILTGLLLK